MKLTDLNARWVGAGGPGVSRLQPDGTRAPAPERHGVGLICDCPCGSCGRELYVPFANPLDGKGQHDRQGWQRTGDTIETLTLRPSVRRLDGCQWHGWITNGEAKPC